MLVNILHQRDTIDYSLSLSALPGVQNVGFSLFFL